MSDGNNIAKFLAPKVEDGKAAEPSASPIEESKPEANREETELERTVRELEVARAGRIEHEIPLNDPYWDALKAHQTAYHLSKV
jgi:hypothetical protein